MKQKYYIGIDPVGNRRSKGMMIVVKETDAGVEVVEKQVWYSRSGWFKKLRWRFYLWMLKRFYNVTIMEESNNPNKATKYFSKQK